MKEYYSHRAKEYEKIYHREDPIRQAEQLEITEVIQKLFKNKKVLEIACGTGYWTERLDQGVAHVTGVDASEETLLIARSKEMRSAEFIVGDAFDLALVQGSFDAALANFWFSHVPKNRIDQFLKGLHSKLQPGAVVFMADNVFVEGVGGKLISKANEGDTYKIRTLDDGSTYEILKNYYDSHELTHIFEPYVEDLTLKVGDCFWWVSYKVK